VTVDLWEMGLRLLAALVAGSAIGYERSFHGRPAGFRTHALVCMASALLMLVTVYEGHWMRQTLAHVTLDPTRMAQGIMTGIGFLGAGAIIKDGLTVRGLTTAASIWITSAIGVLAGIGFYYPLVLAVVLTLGVLSLFRWIESLMPSHAYYQFEVRFARDGGMEEDGLRKLVEEHGFSAHTFSYRLDGEGRVRRYSTVIRAGDRSAAGRLARALHADPHVQEYRIAPSGD
jgi:putative Mg2+ transporter-C (MgtC) family protein